MNRIAGTTIALLLSTSSGAATVPEGNEGLKPLEELITEEALSDQGKMGYIGLRCGALSSAIGVILQNSGQQDVAYQYERTSFLWYAFSTGIYEEIGVSNADDTVVRSAQELVAKYSDITNSNWVTSGSYFSDTFVERDMMLCSHMLARFQSMEKSE